MNDEVAPTCPCGRAIQPWRTRDALFSPASFLGGLVVLTVAALIAFAAPKGSVIGLVMLALAGLAAVVAWLLAAVNGHRGLCLVGRGLWLAVAVPGLPFRVLGALSF